MMFHEKEQLVIKSSMLVACAFSSQDQLWYCDLQEKHLVIQMYESEKSLRCIRLFVTPWTIQSMEFSRPEYWSGAAFPFSRGSSQPRDQTQVSHCRSQHPGLFPVSAPSVSAVTLSACLWASRLLIFLYPHLHHQEPRGQLPLSPVVNGVSLGKMPGQPSLPDCSESC